MKVLRLSEYKKGKVNDMNECTYLGRICTDLVLNKKAMDDKENYWTRFRLAVARKRVKKRRRKGYRFFNCIAFCSLQKESALMQKRWDGFVYVVRTERIISKKMV